MAGGHENHDYSIYISDSGGSCDCGMVEAMDSKGFCPAHEADPEACPENERDARLNAVMDRQYVGDGGTGRSIEASSTEQRP